MEFSFGSEILSRDFVAAPAPGALPVLLGFKRRGKWWQVTDLQECLIFDPQAGAIAQAVKGWARAEGLDVYDARRHRGYLRYLALRKTMSLSGDQGRRESRRDETSGDFMAMIVTSSERDLPKESLIAALGPYCRNVLWGFKDEKSDTAICARYEILKGEDFLTQTLLGRPFRYSWNSFFQTNPQAFELLLDDLVESARTVLDPDRRVLDAYCGVGTIAITLAQRLGVHVLGVESAASSIEDAQLNAESSNGSILLSGLGDLSDLSQEFHSGSLAFMQAQVEKVLPELLARPEYREGLIVLDPPRCGLHPKAFAAILERPPRHLFYVSCNPARMAKEELPRLLQSYKIGLAKAYDFFPQTDHYEAFFVLDRKN
ncbi:MAG: hypothetical protein AAB091_00260 [Elusimicrobiota bacterium]